MMLGRVVQHQQSYVGSLGIHETAAASTTSTAFLPAHTTDDESSISSASDVVLVTSDKASKFDKLHSVRYKLEHNQLTRSTSEDDKVKVFKVLGDHLRSPDWEVKQFAVQLVHDVLPHVGGGNALDLCMAEVVPDLVPCLGSARISLRKAATQAVAIYLRFTADVATALKAIVSYGLENPDAEVVHETLVSVALLFPEDFDDRYCGPQRNLFHLVSGLARKLSSEDTKIPAFMSLQRLADVVGVKQFQAYLSKLTGDQKRIYDELASSRPTKPAAIKLLNNNNDLSPDESLDNSSMNSLVMIQGRKVSAAQAGWFEYGAIDDSIVEKLRDEEDVRVRLAGADELNRAVKSMKDLSPLLPQMRLFLNFLDSVLEGETNFKMVLLVLETYGVLIDRMRHKVKPHLRSLCSALLRHASNSKIVVRIENYRVIKKLMLVAKPNVVLNHFFDHLGDKRSVMREDVLNIVMFALLTFPSNEFDLKNIAATVVPTLVDPKRRVRQASQECVAILAAFMGPAKAAPLIRSIELLENHFERGTGVLNAVQARLSRRQLPRVTQDGLVEYSIQIPRSAMRRASGGGGAALRGRSESPILHNGKKYGADIEWILAGSGSVSSGSAKSISTMHRSESRLDESFSSSNSFPNSPSVPRRAGAAHLNGLRSPTPPLGALNGISKAARSKSEETLASTINLKSLATSRRSSVLTEDVEGEMPERKARKQPSHKGHHENELPRLIGTKSQASTASSSATRDSGISINDVQKAAEEALQSGLHHAATRRPFKAAGGGRSRTGSSRSTISRMISVDDLPISGKAMPLGKRPSTNKSSISTIDLDASSASRTSSKVNLRGEEQQAKRPSFSRSISGGAGAQNNYFKDLGEMPKAASEQKLDGSRKSEIIDDVTPPRSPLVVLSSNKHLLLRPADNSPFSSASVGKKSPGNGCNQSHGSSTNSTPYSQISVPSSYDYEDDFTSESESEMCLLAASANTNNANRTGLPSSSDNRSAHSQRTIKSTNSSGSSRIPIKRNSSLRKKKDVMNQYKSGTDEEEPQTLVIERKPASKVKRPLPDRPHNPISQAEFDDMPIPAVKSSGNFQDLVRGLDEDEDQAEARPPPVVQVKRPFLQRRTSPSKILSSNHSKADSKANAKSPPMRKKANTSTVARSRLPDKRPTKSSSSSMNGSKLISSRMPKSSSNFLKSSSIHKSTPNLAAKTPPPSSYSSSMAKRPLSQERRPTTPATMGKFEDFVDAVPEIPSVSKLARTPPTMLRKVISVNFEEESRLLDEDESEDVPEEEANGQPEDEDVEEDDELGLEVEEEQQQQPPRAPPPTAFTRPPNTASSSVSVANLHYLPLKTQITLKSPLDGNNLGPFHKPEEFLQRTIANLASADWEANVNGMASMVRFARHHPEYLLVEYKPLLQYVNNHVKNLRSQVCRAAVMVVGELFIHLKRNMEAEIEKIMLPLILKSGDTNKFLREDCNVALDAIVENSSPSKVIMIVSTEAVHHKSPLVRTTASRVLAYTVEKMGVHKALSCGKDITDKLLPAIAKLAQDGSPDARNYAKSCLHRMLNEHPDFEKILKKSITPNMMRNLEKVIDALKNHGFNLSNGFSGRTPRSRGSLGGRSRKTL